MEGTMAVNDFTMKFKKLNKQNQKYILAIEQAMLYAQDAGEEQKQEQGERGGQNDE